jgi:hypothetical protein
VIAVEDLHHLVVIVVEVRVAVLRIQEDPVVRAVSATDSEVDSLLEEDLVVVARRSAIVLDQALVNPDVVADRCVDPTLGVPLLTRTFPVSALHCSLTLS